MRFLRFTRSFPLPAFMAACCACLLLSASDAQAAARKPARDVESDAPSTRVINAYHKDWERALKDLRKGDYDDAVKGLQEMGEGDALSGLYKSVVMAQAFWRARDTARADAALAAALSSPAASDVVWQRYLHKMRVRSSAALAAPARKAYLLSATRAPLDNNDKAEAYYRLLALDSSYVSRSERTTFARQLLTVALPGARLEAEYRLWVAAAVAGDDTLRSTQQLLLDAEEKLTLWDAAIARATRLAAGETSPESIKSLQLKIAQWHFNKGAFEKAIHEYLRYRERYGDTPEVLIQLARSYRSLSQDAPSKSWYSRLVERFPRDGRAAETLWMRAFDDEMTGKSDTAIAAYARIARDFPRHVRSGEAMFRRGLVLYRRGDFAAAHKAFTDLRAANKTGRLTGAAHYWEGLALAALGREAEARAEWVVMSRDYPFGHYGHLARQELIKRGALPDSLAWSTMLNRAEGPGIRNWFIAGLRMPLPAADTSAAASVTLDTVKPSGATSAAGPHAGARDSFAPRFGESAWMPVERLFAHGLDTLAVLTLQARANAAPTNLWLVYDAAVRCRTAGFGFEAYRFALRLSDKLPLAQWPAAPVDVLRLFYPPSYIELVRPEAQRADIPAALVLALIKQESGFDPGAVSRVGARGLMQLMPATGAEQARKEGLKGFQTDSLFTPAVNIRLGVAYLRDVLRKHDGNIDYALAHYNAGPTALARWMPRLEGRPMHEAVEDIGYAETREYVKRVGANYKTYQVLWEGTGK